MPDIDVIRMSGRMGFTAEDTLRILVKLHFYAAMDVSGDT